MEHVDLIYNTFDHTYAGSFICEVDMAKKPIIYTVILSLFYTLFFVCLMSKMAAMLGYISAVLVFLGIVGGTVACALGRSK